MASVPWQGMSRQHKKTRTLDLDEGSTPPQWLQVAGGMIIIAVCIVLVSLWLKPVDPPNLILDARPSTSALTIPAIRSLTPDAFTSSAIGPRAVERGTIDMAALAHDDT